MKGNRASSLGEGESHGFYRVAREPGIYSRVTVGIAIENFPCSALSGLLSSYDGPLRNLNYAWQDNMDACGGEPGDRGSLSNWHSDIGIPNHFQE